MRLSYRQCFILAILLAASILAGASVAHGQTATPVNPSFIEFTSADHPNAVLSSYKFCFYASATATTPVRCNDVPKAQAILVSGSTYRVPRAAWSTGLTASTPTNPVDYWFKVAAVGPDGVSAEVAPTIAPFSFRLQTAPLAVTGVTLVQ